MTLWSDEATIEVAAPPEHVYALVSDVTRMGEWSPACYRCEWLSASDGPQVGGRFRGHNKLNGARWSRECIVTTATPGREFAFTTMFRGEESTRWRYAFEPTATGTRVTERYEVAGVPTWIKLLRLIPGMPAKSLRDGQRSMQLTLQRVKAAAEA
ncbi:MAG: SRPBCC family protein [Microthrixaceae bacterium]